MLRTLGFPVAFQRSYIIEVRFGIFRRGWDVGWHLLTVPSRDPVTIDTFIGAFVSRTCDFKPLIYKLFVYAPQYDETDWRFLDRGLAV
jgi:hypothetical protein